MCGILGYVGDRQAAPLLLKGLKLLEYRGYDSAGLAVLNKDWNIDVLKKAGKISELEEEFNSHALSGSTGISHTRWATHGGVNDVNAHPHKGCNGEISIVHNGIIENASELKEILEAKGHSFVSETDSEVIAHLLEHNLTGSLESSLMKSMAQLEGSFAIVALRQDNEKIVAARRNSPLVVGLGEGENFVASDTSPFLEYTRNVNFLDEGEVVVLTKDSVKVFTAKGVLVDKKVRTLRESSEEIDMGGHDTYMHKEIYEQPDVMRNNLDVLEGSEVKLSLGFNPDFLKNIGRIIITACGTSWHAGLIGEYILENTLGVPVEVEYASEFRYRAAPLGKKDLVIGISQSGETADTIAALREATSRGAATLGIVNVEGSTIARMVDERLMIKAGKEIGVASTKAFTGQVLALNLLALYIDEFTGRMDVEDRKILLEEIKRLPHKIETVLGKDEAMRDIARIYDSREGLRNALFMGRGINFPTALEGALKLKEISYVHAEGYPAAEMKHGPIALIDENMPSVFIANNGSELYKKVLSNMEEVKARGGRIITITDTDEQQLLDVSDHLFHVPQTHPCLSPILNVVPLQLLAYHIAANRGLDVDKPRNLAKSVTVE